MTSPEIWVAIFVIVAVVWRLSVVERHRRRAEDRSAVLAEKARNSDCQRQSESLRSSILEMLISQEELPAVLDAVKRLMRVNFPETLCAILMKIKGEPYTAFGPDLPAEWLAALADPAGIPAEVWHAPIEDRQPAAHPVWSRMVATSTGRAPAMVRSWPIGESEAAHGALVLCYPAAAEHPQADLAVVETGIKLFRLALEQELARRGHSVTADADTSGPDAIAEEIRQGLAEGHFVVYYQPKVNQDRKVVGFEALVRMRHPERGIVPPATFIPVAEDTGLVVPLGAWVLEEVCRQLSEWQERGLELVPVAVNVSALQLSLDDFAQTVGALLQRYAIPAATIELELTERLLVSAAGVVQNQLQALRDLGVKLSIDDFGTGYSSLSYLHRLRVDAIKLDKSFIQSIDSDVLAHNLVKAVIGVAEALGLSVVAEGIETEAQCEALITAGCPTMQGYLFARPRPAGEAEAPLGPAQAVTAGAAAAIEAALSNAAAAKEEPGYHAALPGSPVLAA